MIKQLTNENINDAFSIIESVIIEMKKSTIDQWDEIYPNKFDIENDIISKSAYGFFIDTNLCGYIAFNDKYSPEYNNIRWSVNDGKFLIVHRLAVTPKEQGKGIAKSLMGFSEQHAKENRYNSIRLDAFSKNPVALKLYENLSFSKVGSIQFRKGIFYLFEKKIVN